MNDEDRVKFFAIKDRTGRTGSAPERGRGDER
jgi:hypothetical protein